MSLFFSPEWKIEVSVLRSFTATADWIQYWPNEVCVSRYSVDKVSNTQSVSLGQLQSKQDTLRSGSSCSRSSKKRGLAIHHRRLLSLSDCSMMAEVRHTSSGSSFYIFSGVISGCDVIRAGIFLLYTLNKTFWKPLCFTVVLRKSTDITSTPY